MSIVRLVFGALCATGLSAQVITTVAGTDFVFPNSVPALNAPLGPVYSVAADASGNVYAADSFNAIIARISPNGNLTVVAGNGLLDADGDGIAATGASLNQPGLVALDSAGNIYFYDAGRVRKVSNGIITTIAGVAGNNGYSGDGGPATSALINYSGSGLVVDSAGAVYFADNNTCRVRKIAGGIISTVVGNGQCAFSGDGGPAVSASISDPNGLALDLSGNLYIADDGNGRIRKVSSGIITTVAGGPNGDTSGNLSSVDGITLDSSGNLYIASANRIFKVTSGVLTPYAGNGTMGLSGNGGPALSASLNSPYGIAFDGSGNLYIADSGNALIRRVTASGIMGPVAGNQGFKFSGDGGPATSATFYNPNSVAVDAAGNVYIADTSNNRIRKVTNGVVTTFAGNGVPGYTGDGGPATSASLNEPLAVAVDSAGAVFIADYQNNVIRKVSGGTISTVAGNGTFGFSGDGGPAKAANLATPAGIAVDSTGNLYIADAQNDRIRKVSNGIITTVAGNGMMAFSGDGGPAASASLEINPYSFVGLAVDAVGNLYIADTANNRVRVVSSGSGGNGMITTFAGNGQGNPSGDGGPAISAGLSPNGLVIDQDGSLYISDTGGPGAVRKVSNSTISTVAGNGSYLASGDGGPATSAGVNDPAGLALDSTGNLFIAEPENGRIREVLKTAPAFQVSPATLNVSAISGGTSPAARVATITSSTTGLPYTTFSSVNWLSVNPPAGSTPASLQLIVDPSQLIPGGYLGTVSISAPNALPTTQTLTVHLTVSSPVASGLLVSSQTLSFAAAGGSGPQTSELTVMNQGSGIAHFIATATSTGGNWLQVSPSSGTVSAMAPVSLTVTANPGSLTTGTYSGAITVSSADTGQNLTIPVTLAISAPKQEILLSQSGLTFTAVAQGGTPLPQSLAILNTGAGTLNWTASVFTSPPASGWLSVSAGSGTVNRPFLDVSTIDVNVDASALTAGTYYGQVQVSSGGASNSPQITTVILVVLPPGSDPGPDVSPIGLVFTGVAGAAVNPPTQSIFVANVTASSINFGSGVAPSTASYIHYRPQGGAVLPNVPVEIDVQPDFSMLAPGPNFATLTLTFSDETFRTISILTVAAPGAPTSSERPSERQTSACIPTKLLPEFTLVGSSSNVTLGFPAYVQATIVDDCGAPLTQGSAVVSFSNGDAQLSLISLQNGIWTNTWTPGNAAANVTLTLRAGMPAQNLTGTTQAASVSLLQGSLTPPTLSGGPLGAGSLAQGPFAPGDVMLIKGNGLADFQSSATTTPLQNQLAGASLLIGSKSASLLYADSGQVVGLVPLNVPVNGSQQVLLQKDNTYGNPVSVIIAPTHPAILTADGSGKGQGLVYNAGAGATTMASGPNPAAVGSTVIIYCTGLGATDSTGRVSNAVTMSIGGQAAQVNYAGVALPQAYPPGGAPMLLGLVSGALGGLYQVTATVPGGLANGPGSVTISSAGQTSQAGVTLVVTGGVSASGGPPAIMAVVNAATQIDATHGVAPNTFVSIYSSNIGTTSNLNLFPTTNFLGLEALFNGNAAPLYAVAPSANQINVVVPSELPGTGTAMVTVQNASGLSANVALTLAKDSAGVFRIPDAAHPNNAAVELAGTLEIVMPASTAAFYGFTTCTTPVTATCAQPARPGDNIVIYFTGGGLATPNGDPAGQPVATGSIAPVNGIPLYKTVQTPTVTIGGIAAGVQFSGIAPGTAAEYQLNTQIPAGVQPGDSVPVILTFANSSDTVTIAVQAP